MAADPASWLRDGIARCLQRHLGMDESQAATIAAAAVDHLQAEYGGERVYIPARSKAARNQAIRREFNGRNLDELCKKYQLSAARIYQIISAPRPE